VLTGWIHFKELFEKVQNSIAVYTQGCSTLTT